MHIRLTLAGSGGGATPTDVMVMASEPTTVHDLRPHLVPWLPRRRPLYADGSPLSDDDVLGAPPLVHGAVLSDASANLDDEVLQGVLQIRVVGGPCAGAVHRVVPGEITRRASTRKRGSHRRPRCLTGPRLHDVRCFGPLCP